MVHTSECDTFDHKMLDEIYSALNKQFPSGVTQCILWLYCCTIISLSCVIARITCVYSAGMVVLDRAKYLGNEG